MLRQARAEAVITVVNVARHTFERTVYRHRVGRARAGSCFRYGVALNPFQKRFGVERRVGRIQAGEQRLITGQYREEMRAARAAARNVGEKVTLQWQRFQVGPGEHADFA